MSSHLLPTFDDLLRRMGGTSVHPREDATEAERLIAYLQGLGFGTATTDEVLAAIEADPTEEELSAYRCVEGVAVAHASEGWWLLFRYNEPIVASSDAHVVGSSLVQSSPRAC